MGSTDLSLHPDQIVVRLQEQLAGFSFYQYHDEVTSTNDLAKECARANYPEIGVVVAERQTAGRGRMGRKWVSEAGGGLWTSILLRPRLAPDNAGILSLAVGVAVYDALKSLYSIDDLSVKWPNDILVSGMKLAGILVETGSSLSRLNWAVIGVGINVAPTFEFTTEAATPPAFLSMVTGRGIQRGELLVRILGAFVELYRKQPFAESVLAKYTPICETVGKDIRCSTKHGWVQGRAVGVDRSGALLLATEDGKQLVRLRAADTSLRDREVGRAFRDKVL